MTLSYDGHARLASYAATGAPSQAMTYNGRDERIKLVTTPSGGGTSDTRYFLYDQHHRLIGEYGATVADLRAEHIWLLPEVGGAAPFGGDDGLGGYMPLAVVVPAGGSTTIHWVQGNHLGTPVAVTDGSGAIATPSGYSMAGFPGQVRQHAELYYNYYRDYDVSLGRYVQADPIGLDGDTNPYLYAAANPLSGIDPEGLQGGAAAPLDPRVVAWEAGAKHFGRNLIRPSRKVPVVGQALLIGDGIGTLAAIAYYGYINPPKLKSDCHINNSAENGGGGGRRTPPVIVNNYGESNRCVDQWENDVSKCQKYWKYNGRPGESIDRRRMVNACEKRAEDRLHACRHGFPLPPPWTARDYR
ncbi:RHS repeat-associated core domain-containing protein [Sphingopyxis sp. PET50]|uniref:RHS repeat-associated core domain-containing protein n=1 Tax=Sphingopyxis sp. PET50 TaxID=2976533 RepID=UPI00391ABD83